MSRLAMFAVLAAAVCLAGASGAGDDPKVLPFKLVTHKVKTEKIPLRFQERGVLEAVNRGDVVCRLKAPVKGDGVAAVIKKLFIEDGERVKKGQLLLELDAGPLEEQLKAQTAARDRAQGELKLALDTLELARTHNEDDLATARVNLKVAQMKEEEHKGIHEQAVLGIRARIIRAESEADQQQEALEQAERRLKVGGVTEDQVRAVRRRLEAARLDLQSGQLALKGLQQNSGPAQEATLQGTVAEARRAVERADKHAKLKEAAVGADVEAKKAIVEQETERCKELQAEIAKCKLVAPRDGVATYHVAEPKAGGQAPIIAVGEPVREGQKLISVQSLEKMQLLVRVPEAQVAQVQPGMAVQVQVDAFPNRKLRGAVTRVESKPSSSDFFRTGDKVYLTTILIDGNVEGLLPGMTGSAAIDLARTLENVLMVPARALIGKVGVGKTVSCLILTKEGVEEREVVIGLDQGTSVGIVSGLREGDEVIANPRLLLDEIRGQIRLRGK